MIVTVLKVNNKITLKKWERRVNLTYSEKQYCWLYKAKDKKYYTLILYSNKSVLHRDIGLQLWSHFMGIYG